MTIEALAVPEEAVIPVAETGDAVRAHPYHLLAALLAHPPSAEVIDVLRGIDPAAGAGEGAMATAWQTLRLAGQQATVEDLGDEYHALFIGVGRGELVPFGSWHMTGFMMDQPLATLRRDLQALGFERQDDVYEPEDHVAALCETMAMMVGDEDQHSLDVQRRFFEKHLGPWVGTFFSDLQQAKSSRFYRAVGEFGGCFVDFERTYFGMLA